MSPLPTPNAPTTSEELKQLLKDDNKVKVAGKLQVPAIRIRLMTRS